MFSFPLAIRFSVPTNFFATERKGAPHWTTTPFVQAESECREAQPSNFPKVKLQLRICRIHALLVVSLCGWVFSRFFPHHCSCLMDSGVGMVGHFRKKNKNVSHISCSILQIWGMFLQICQQGIHTFRSESYVAKVRLKIAVHPGVKKTVWASSLLDRHPSSKNIIAFSEILSKGFETKTAHILFWCFRISEQSGHNLSARSTLISPFPTSAENVPWRILEPTPLAHDVTTHCPMKTVDISLCYTEAYKSRNCACFRCQDIRQNLGDVGFSTVRLARLRINSENQSGRRFRDFSVLPDHETFLVSVLHKFLCGSGSHKPQKSYFTPPLPKKFSLNVQTKHHKLCEQNCQQLPQHSEDNNALC